MKKLLLGAAAVAVLSTTMIGGATEDADAATSSTVVSGEKGYTELKTALTSLSGMKHKYLTAIVAKEMPRTLQTEVRASIAQAKAALKSDQYTKLKAAHERLTAVYAQIDGAEVESFDFETYGNLKSAIAEAKALTTQKTLSSYERPVYNALQRAEAVVQRQSGVSNHELEGALQELQQAINTMDASIAANTFN